MDECRSVDSSRVCFSHYLGVSWNRQSQIWQARFHKPDATWHLVGDFKEEEAAGRAYDEYALKHYGNGAVRNYPPSTYTGDSCCSDLRYNHCLQAQPVTVFAAVSTTFLVVPPSHLPTAAVI